MIQQVQDLFDANVTKVMDSFPSIYTKDDVVNLLTALRNDTINEIIQSEAHKPVSIITEEMFQDFSVGVERKLDNYLTRTDQCFIDYSSAEFSIEYNNQLVLESVDFDSNTIVEELDNILLTEFQNIFGELITSK
jgi:hypothetical protein